MKKKAIVLLSGGLDSAATLYHAKSKGFDCACLVFDYGQRHRKELRHAVKIAEAARCDYKIVKIGMPWLGSSLLDRSQALPQREKIDPKEIPSTYVPARNIIFLSFAASFAEAAGAATIFIGANAVDYSGYPDCRPAFLEAFQLALSQGMKTGVRGHQIRIRTPLLKMTKARIIKLAQKLRVPLGLTWSCYEGSSRPCGKCDSCVLRRKGFEAAGIKDPAV